MGVGMDGSAIASAISGFKAASDIAAALVGLGLKGRELEAGNRLLGALREANQSAIAAQSEYFTLHREYLSSVARIGQLEKELMQLKGLNPDSESYQLSQVGPGAFAYALKPGARVGKPAHWLCPNCFSNGHKSILQHDPDFSVQGETYICPRCKNDITASKGRHPTP